MKIMEFQKKYLLWRIDISEPLRIPDFRVLETVETGETYAIVPIAADTKCFLTYVIQIRKLNIILLSIILYLLFHENSKRYPFHNISKYKQTIID